MLNKVSSLARALGIILAVVAGFVANLGGLDVALALVVLGILAGITMPEDRRMGVMLSILVLPAVGTALGSVPQIGAQLGAVAGNLVTLIGGSLATTIAIILWNRCKEDLTGLGK